MVHFNHPLSFMLYSTFLAQLKKMGTFIESINIFNIIGWCLLERKIHMLETSRIVFHCKNGRKKSFSLGIFHSCIRLLLVEVERFDILWEPTNLICNNDSKTLITITIKNSFRNKLFSHRHCQLLMEQLPLSGHTSTDHFQQITLNYVEFLWPCI